MGSAEEMTDRHKTTGYSVKKKNSILKQKQDPMTRITSSLLFDTFLTSIILQNIVYL